MTQPISPALVARAALSYLKPAANKPNASAAIDSSPSPLPGRGSGTDFVIELSAAAKQHMNSRSGDVGRSQTQRLNGGQVVRNADDDVSVDSVQETSFDIAIGEGGSGRREAPLSKPDGSVILKPPGSIIDVRI